MTQLTLPSHLQQHSAFKRVFQPGKLTFGLIAPFKGYPEGPIPNMDDHRELAQMADEGGISALWLRDVPFYDPTLVTQVRCMTRWLIWLPGRCDQNIALGTAGIVSR
jgi:alkanesulfonate monooxygenase SsuD/methylene tetrahydromethanopterin reductase-like flavin-dependent oxidoreductase (luciferase family)